MAVVKKWYEYPRPIPFDELQQRVMIERYHVENKLRRDWHRKYNKASMQFAVEKDKCLCAKKNDQGTSLYVFAPSSTRKNHKATTCCCEPTSIIENQETNINENINSNTPAATHEGQKPTAGKDIFCIASPNPALHPTDNSKSEKLTKFRQLNWPPKCNHVCARMGFDCWMC